jgi:hypothetical protein
MTFICELLNHFKVHQCFMMKHGCQNIWKSWCYFVDCLPWRFKENRRAEGERIIFPILGSCANGYRISQNQYIRDCDRDYDPIKSRIARAIGLPSGYRAKTIHSAIPQAMIINAVPLKSYCYDQMPESTKASEE